MKRTICFLIAFALFQLNGWCQDKTNDEWVKNPATLRYSLDYEKKAREEFYIANQKKYSGTVKLAAVLKEAESNNEEKRMNSIKNLGLIGGNNQISKIESILVNDPSLSVRMECAKSLKYLKSTKSIPVLKQALRIDDRQLKLEVALTLAALGEKTECFKALQALGATKERNIILDTHLGYLDLGTPEAVEMLKTDLKDTNAYITVDAAIVLAELGFYKEAFPVLNSKLSDEDKFIRMAALRGLAYIGNEKSINLIKSMLNDREPLVRKRSELILKNCQLN